MHGQKSAVRMHISYLTGWCLVSQGISTESLLMKILTISAWFWKSNGCFMEQLMLVFDSPKLCLLLWILPTLYLWPNRANGLTMDCWYYLDLSFLLEYCLYPVCFLALLIWKQIQHSLSNSVSKLIHILKLVLNSCFPWISLLLFCNVHSLHFSCEVKTSLSLLYWLLCTF